MQPERVVEIRRDGASVGTGYLIASRHVLTARHVVTPNVRGAPYQIWPLSGVGDEALPLAKRKRPPKRKAWLDWWSSTHDFAILALEADGVAGIPSGTVAFGRVRDDGLSFRFVSSGLPEASGDLERRIEGSMNWVRPNLHFDINVSNGAPEDWSAWGGFSGAAIFSGGLLVAVVCEVDKNWRGQVLEATPVQFLREDAHFETYCRKAGLALPMELPIARYNVPLLDWVSAQLHLVDRHQAEGIRDVIKGVDEKQTAPLVFVISGVDEDEHRQLIKRLASEPAIRKRLGKNASPERVIPELFWPGEWKIDPTVQLRDKLAAELSEIIRPSKDAVTTNPVEWRNLFEHKTTTRGFWIMLRRAQAGPGHAELLQSWLKLWSQLGKGRLVVLFLCIAWDDPPRPLPSPIPSFLRRAPSSPDPKLAGVVQATITAGQSMPVDPLTEIIPSDLGPWLERIRPLCRHGAHEQLDGLRSLLLHFIESGKRLRPIDRQLGALRHQFETVAKGGAN
jgi:hypothetical protein